MENSKLLIIADYPSPTDYQEDTVMQGRKDRIFWKVFNDVVKGHEEDLELMYAFPTRPQSDGYFTEDDVTESLRTLNDRILQTGCTKAIVLGTLAASLVDHKKQLKDLRKKPLRKAIDKKHVVDFHFTYSPGQVEKVPKLLKTFATDIGKVYGKFKGYSATDATRTIRVRTLREVEELISYIEETGECFFDFETVSIAGAGIYDDDFIATMLSVSFQHGCAYTIPLDHYETCFTEDEVMLIMAMFSERVFANPDIRKIAHNLKFDIQVARRYGCRTFRGRLDDTMLMHHIINELSLQGLKEILPGFYPEFSGWEDETKSYKNKWHLIPLETLEPYAGVDTDGGIRLCTALEAILLQDMRLYRLYRNLSMFALRSLCQAEVNGMLVDRGAIGEYIGRTDELLKDLEKRMRSHPQVIRYELAAGEDAKDKALNELREKMERTNEFTKTKDKVTGGFKPNANYARWKAEKHGLITGLVSAYDGINFGSDEQLSSLLYSRAGFGFPNMDSVDKEALNSIVDDSGFLSDLLLFRTIKKTKGTYLEGLLSRLDRFDRVHTSFKQHGTKTGRLSSADPNLQNLTNVTKLIDPIAIEVVSMVKQSFIVPPGMVLLQADYSQAELRIVAEYANETNMIDAYNKDLDLHALTASFTMGMSIEDFYTMDAKEQKKFRQRAKAVNFGLIYGMSAEGLVDYAKNSYGVILTLDEARRMRAAFFKLYPRLEEYHDLYKAKGRKYGYVRTMFGRCRRLPRIASPDQYTRGEEERRAVNSPIQGTAGEFTIFCAALLHYRLPRSVQFVNTIHDSLLYYVPKNLVHYAADVIQHTATNPPTKLYFGRELEKLKMKVDLEYTETRWKDLEPYSKELVF